MGQSNKVPNPNDYTYQVLWSTEDNEHVGVCLEFPSLSYLAKTVDEALAGIKRTVENALVDMITNHETIPQPNKWLPLVEKIRGENGS